MCQQGPRVCPGASVLRGRTSLGPRRSTRRPRPPDPGPRVLRRRRPTCGDTPVLTTVLRPYPSRHGEVPFRPIPSQSSEWALTRRHQSVLLQQVWVLRGARTDGPVLLDSRLPESPTGRIKGDPRPGTGGRHPWNTQGEGTGVTPRGLGWENDKGWTFPIRETYSCARAWVRQGSRGAAEASSCPRAPRGPGSQTSLSTSVGRSLGESMTIFWSTPWFSTDPRTWPRRSCLSSLRDTRGG